MFGTSMALRMLPGSTRWVRSMALGFAGETWPSDEGGELGVDLKDGELGARSSGL